MTGWSAAQALYVFGATGRVAPGEEKTIEIKVTVPSLLESIAFHPTSPVAFVAERIWIGTLEVTRDMPIFPNLVLAASGLRVELVPAVGMILRIRNCSNAEQSLAVVVCAKGERDLC